MTRGALPTGLRELYPQLVSANRHAVRGFHSLASDHVVLAVIMRKLVA